MRLRTRWKDKTRPRSTAEQASVIGTALWKIAAEAVLNLENENFQTDTQAQRLDVIMEHLTFGLHLLDRLCYGRLPDADRAELVTATAQHVAKLVHDNSRQVLGEGSYRDRFIELLNTRSGEYAEHGFEQGEPAFGMLLAFGYRVCAVMGPRDNRWLLDHMVAIEGPEILDILKKTVSGFLEQRQMAEEPSAAGENG